MAQAYQPKLRSNLSLMALAAFASGCQSVPNAASYAQPYPAYDYSSVAPAAGPALSPGTPAPMASAQPQAPAYSPVPYQALEASTLELKDRLERVEKAMLRLDRRMQLVERNELGRMGTPTAQNSTSSGYTTTDVSMNEEQAAMSALNIGPGQSSGNNRSTDGYRPVSSRDEGITSALQAAPSLAQDDYASGGNAPVQVASRNGLPSLADPAPSASHSLQPGNNQVAIWTVKYEPTKIWPDRTQLPTSRDVVEILRQSGAASSNSSGAALTLYARGKNPNAVEFRERVKALSRYLSKVSSLDSVPIAAMPAPYLDDQTIEILATH